MLSEYERKRLPGSVARVAAAGALAVSAFTFSPHHHDRIGTSPTPYTFGEASASVNPNILTIGPEFSTDDFNTIFDNLFTNTPEKDIKSVTLINGEITTGAFLKSMVNDEAILLSVGATKDNPFPIPTLGQKTEQSINRYRQITIQHIDRDLDGENVDFTIQKLKVIAGNSPSLIEITGSYNKDEKGIWKAGPVKTSTPQEISNQDFYNITQEVSAKFKKAANDRRMPVGSNPPPYVPGYPDDLLQKLIKHY